MDGLLGFLNSIWNFLNSFWIPLTIVVVGIFYFAVIFLATWTPLAEA